MKAEEIREWHSELGELMRNGDLKPHEVVRARARIEIAAQLAEMNVHLAKIADPPVTVYTVDSTPPDFNAMRERNADGR